MSAHHVRARAALAATLLAALAAPALADPDVGTSAKADPCWVTHRRGPFPACFDPGNRLHLDVAGNDPDAIELGGAIELRHVVLVDDPDVSWRLEHRIAAIRASADDIRASVYAGRFVRHSTDGHLVLPFGRPRKLFLPFDIGAEAEVGTLRARSADDAIQVGAVRTAALFELSRTGSFRRRFAIGPVARWDIELDRDSRSARAHRVAPFSLGGLDLRAESRNGLTIAGLRAEAGGVWSTEVGWRRWLAADAELERVFMSIQDRPLSVFVGASFAGEDESLSAVVGLRFSPLVRIPPRGASRPDPGGS
jgi:hypothetical protein